MATIVWHKKAKQEFRNYVENARIEFGMSTARSWQKQRKEIEWRLVRYPSSYTPEPLLGDMDILYRSCQIMHRRFKIIYTYDEISDVVHVMDIWDTRMNPKALIKRIK